VSTLYLVRHGETAWNREQVFRGRADVPLGERGHQQAGLVAQALRAEPIKAVYASPLARAVDTARPLSEELGIDLIQEESLQDMNFGEWEGQSLVDVRREWPELYQVWEKSPDRFCAPAGETLADVLDRAWRAIEHMAERHAGTAVAAVSHRVVCKLLVCRALGMGEAGFWRVRLDTASVSVLEHQGDEWTLTGVNDTCHLRSLGAGDAADF
jgi:broad specificity phosphatase PhoE